jgi:hypothetical protein
MERRADISRLRAVILLFIALVLARFTYAEKLTVMFWFFAIFGGMDFSVLREAEFTGG